MTLAIMFSGSLEAASVTLQGSVLDYKNDPVPNAKVWVSHDRQVYTGQTDATGEFLFRNLGRGKIEIVAMCEGHSLGGKEGQLLSDMNVTIKLDKPTDLSIRVINGKYEPIEGARLKSMFINEAFTVNIEDLSQHGFPSVRSNDAGIMIIPHMPRFGYTSLATSHPQYAEGMLPTFPIGTDVDLIMNPGIDVRGRVRNEDGIGVGRARVAISKFVQGNAMKFAEVLSDSDGFYTITVPPAQYFVTASHSDYAIAEPVGFSVNAGSEEVIADLTLPMAHFVIGRFVNQKSGDPVALTKVEYKGEQGTVFAETLSDVNGRFNIKVHGGIGHLVVTPPERLMTVMHNEIRVEIEEVEVSVGTIALKPLPAIWGKVLDNRKEPIANAFVRTLNSDPAILTQTDAEGEYYIQLERMIIDEKLEIYVEHPYRFQRALAKIGMNEAGENDIEMRSFRPLLEFIPELAPNDLSELANEEAPPLECSDWFNLTDGKDSLSLEELRGKIVVLTFWAGFDLSGRSQNRITEIKYLHSIFRENPDVQFIGIHDASLQPYEVELVIGKAGISFPVGCDDNSFATFSAYSVHQIPQTVIIGPEGDLRYYEVEGRLHALIKGMLRGQ